MIGSLIGPYEVLGKLGEGGMGQVYRARDSRLNRDVAIKVLPDAFVRDDERLARFTREARVLASLDHPNIARVYGVEFPSPSIPALVMECVEGDDLAERIASGRMPLPEAMAIARQIAEALETAHEQGIVHRDLKPANVKVRRDGCVKVLDFGLAKITEGAAVEEVDGAAQATITSPAMTHAGVLLGTAAYMAPEQARGRAVDKRADIWSFGALLYELVTGTRAFDGQSVSDVLAAVVRHEIDWSRLPGETPPALRQLLARCLEPDVRQRLRDIGEARVAISALEHGSTSAVGASTDVTRRHSRRKRLAWSLAAAAVLGAAGIIVWSLTSRRDPAVAAGAVTRLSVPPPTGFLIYPDSTNVVISPNGRMVAFTVGTGVSTENQLWVRALDSSEARRIETGDGAALPFWSPDSGSIGFVAGGKLKIVSAAGGAAHVLSNTPFARGAAWSSSNVIVFAPDSSGPLFRVPAGGGAVTPVTTLDATRKESGHRFPFFLPDGDHFLYAALPGTDGMFNIFVGRLSVPNTRTLIGSMESAPVYARASAGSARGWLLFTRQGVLVAQPFDTATLKLSGDAVTLGDQPSVAPGPGAYDAGRRISTSTTGSLAYYLAPAGNVSVQWMDLAGKTRAPLDVPKGRYTGVAIAPDASKAVLVRSASPGSSDLWIVDLTRPSAVPLATGVSRLPNPIWSPDSTRIIFSSESPGTFGLSEKSVIAGSSERQVFRSDVVILPQHWSTDLGIVVNRIDPGTKWNVYRLEAPDSATLLPLATGPSIEAGGRPSPNRQWLAYLSDEAGRLDLYLQPIPAGQKTQVAAAVQHYWWTPDGKAILYTTRAQTLWRVEVDLRGPAPRIAPAIQLASLPSTLVDIDLAPDGNRFLALVPERSGLGTVAIVQSWESALAGR
jgi:eukaryotic-like serine/threonine-protein kinase